MPQLRWIQSYKMPRFDTPDGDLHKGQYSILNDVYLVRENPENNSQVTALDPFLLTQKVVDEKISGLTFVGIVPNQDCYYDEYAMPDDNRIYREVSTKKDYEDLAKPKAKGKEKFLTAQEVIEVKKDDYKWL